MISLFLVENSLNQNIFGPIVYRLGHQVPRLPAYSLNAIANKLWPVRLVVRTSGSHPENRSPILLRATN